MALTPLAGMSDLLAHAPAGFSPDMSKAFAKLDAASDAVRDAAGSPITQAESTVRIVAAGCGSWLDLPGKPVVSVSSVTIEGEPVTGWRLLGSRLYRAGEWAHGGPVEVQVTMVHGFAEAPADVVALVCDFAIAALLNESGARAGVTSQGYSIDDYRENLAFDQGPHGTSSVIEIPAGTRAMLRQRFGAAAFVTGAS
ncbi:MAG TPA: hypothetical protein PLZ92_11445 [Phycicoccus sp.]|nr:hypothetical protein [Phycicoccus sp.]